MKITYYGHAAFGVEVAGIHLLFDPFIRPNPKAKSIDISRLKPDFILLSHGHADHVHDAADIARQSGATLVAGFEVCEWFGRQGIEKRHPLNHGGAWNFPFGRVQFVNAIHSSSLPDGSYGGQPGGFVIRTKEGNFYYSGDTALTMDMKLIGESTPLLFAALCIGGNFTMDAADAVRAAEFVRCKKVLGLHYDTFPPIAINHQEAQSIFQKAGKELHLLEIGASLEITPSPPGILV